MTERTAQSAAVRFTNLVELRRITLDIDRVLVKSQAKQIIKGNMLKLFLVSIVVAILISSVNIFSSVYSIYNNDLSNISGYSDFFNFKNDDNDNNSDRQPSQDNGFDRGYFDNFTGKVTLMTMPSTVSKSIIFNSIRRGLYIASLIFMPLSISLFGLYIMVVRGKRFSVSQEFKYVFQNAFDKNYFKKWLLCLIQGLIISLLFCLFIVPSIICYYKYYFAFAIMTDNPEISPGDAIKISKRMTKGHKGELFALDVSFIGWFLLGCITCGLALIYVLPYYMATRALYYENFRIRAFQEGRLNALDFMSPEEKARYYQAKTYYQPPNSSYGSGMGTDYYNNNF